MTENEKTTNKPPAPNKAGRGLQRNAPELGIAGAIIIVWILKTFVGVEPDADVTLALGVVIGAVAARIKDLFEKR